MLWGVFVILFGLWSLGLVEGVGDSLIRALLVITIMPSIIIAARPIVLNYCQIGAPKRFIGVT